jgi:hypothetical protein
MEKEHRSALSSSKAPLFYLKKKTKSDRTQTRIVLTCWAQPLADPYQGDQQLVVAEQA